jgi:hypothetical protein
MSEVPPTLLASQEETDFGSRTDSPVCQKLVAQWKENCLKNHPRCRERSKGDRLSQEGRWIPTRLLHILYSGSKKTVRLTERDNSFFGPFEPYVTLSHCWGASQPTRLLTSKLETFKQGILVAGLPQTFRDAVEVCGWLSG